jgi:hypothetical protein
MNDDKSSEEVVKQNSAENGKEEVERGRAKAILTGSYKDEMTEEQWQTLETYRAWMALAFGIIASLLFALVARQLVILNDRPEISVDHCTRLLSVVAMSGMVGGCVSMVRRMQTITRDCDGTTLSHRPALSLVSAGAVSCLLGGIFAMILYYVFLGAMISGTLFPQFVTKGDITQTIVNPLSTPDMAKLIVFAFIAGFAERLVPDTLDRLSASSKSGQANSGKKFEAIRLKHESTNDVTN